MPSRGRSRPSARRASPVVTTFARGRAAIRPPAACDEMRPWHPSPIASEANAPPARTANRRRVTCVSVTFYSALASRPGRQSEDLSARAVGQDIQRTIRSIGDAADARVELGQQTFLADDASMLDHQPHERAADKRRDEQIV